jgi:Holliday junction resolvasome RuvABC ATP-dependent DNA helicase subunit
MRFIGQKAIMEQLSVLLPYFYSNPDCGKNFLLSAPSGWGKTRMGFLICNYLSPSGKYQYTIATEEGTPFDESIHVHFIDEVHTIKTPEFLYRYMDMGTYVIVLSTNDTGTVKEPLLNRCIPLLFTAYSIEELRAMVRGVYTYSVNDAFVDEIINAGYKNPRVILLLAARLVLYTKQRGIPKNIAETLSSFFGIEKGLDAPARRYLEILQELGGRASISLLSAMTHTSRAMLESQVEPVLLYHKKIQITSKGRILT